MIVIRLQSFTKSLEKYKAFTHRIKSLEFSIFKIVITKQTK